MTANRLDIVATGMEWPSHDAGGLNTYFKNICERLSGRHRIDALVCCERPPEREAANERLRIVNVASPRSPMGRRQRAFRTVAEQEMDSRLIDIVYSQFAPYGLGPALAARRRNIPVLMNFQGPWAEEMKVESSGLKGLIKARIARKVEQDAYRLANRFIVLSQEFKHILHTNYGISQDKIHIIPGAADTERFRIHPDRLLLRDRLGIPADRTIVLSVRRLVNRMGLLQLVEGWQEVIRQEPDALLLIGGKGPLHAELQMFIRNKGLEGHVRLLGYIPDDLLPAYYQTADLFVVPTQALEGFGLITVEALACGVPVLATPVGGNKEILQRFRPEFLCDDATSGALARGICQALRQRGQWPSPQACRNHVLDHYTWDRVAGEVEKLLASMALREGVGV